MPRQLLMKESLVGDRGQSEVNFYEMAKSESSLPTFEYFGYLETSKTAPLAMLFNDLTASHIQTPWPVIPSLEACKSAVGALAQIHGHWWGRLTSNQVPTFDGLNKDIQRLKKYYPDYRIYVGEYFSDRHDEIYHLIFANLAKLKASRIGVATLVHTDPHYWNFLYPKDASKDDCVVFDWPLWRFGFAGDDLGYLIASHLYPEHRNRFEPLLLQDYFEKLEELGVEYARDDLQLDYRLGVITALLMPLQEFAWKIPPHDWLPKLEKALSAFDEHDCLSLLKD